MTRYEIPKYVEETKAKIFDRITNIESLIASIDDEANYEQLMRLEQVKDSLTDAYDALVEKIDTLPPTAPPKNFGAPVIPIM
jgi:vacuolar-type H+-ATPase subunit E/Vma4